MNTPYPENYTISPVWVAINDGSLPAFSMPAAAEDGDIVFDSRENRFIYYGGKTDDNTALSETWFYYPSENQWVKMTESELTPPPREDHVLVYDEYRHKVILHGGEDGPTSNDLWELDLITNQWTDKTTPESPFLEDHSGIYAAEYRGIYYFGGQNESFMDLNEIWFLNLDPESPQFYRWQRIFPGDKRAPMARRDHSLVFDPHRRQLYLFGGWRRATKTFLTDTWAFHLDSLRWREIKILPGQMPPPRRHAGSALDKRNHIWIIYGGDGVNSTLNDTWAFLIDREIWVQLTPGPSARKDHNLLYNPADGEIYLYGGDATKKNSRAKLHDLWKLKIDLPAPPDSATIFQDPSE